MFLQQTLKRTIEVLGAAQQDLFINLQHQLEQVPKNVSINKLPFDYKQQPKNQQDRLDFLKYTSDLIFWGIF